MDKKIDSLILMISVSGIMTANLSPIESKKDIWAVQLYLIEGMGNSDFQTLDRDFYQKKIDKLADLVGEESVNLPRDI